MTIAQTDVTSERQPLRLWPGIAATLLQSFFSYGLPRVVPGTQAQMIGALGGLACALIVIVWWTFFSRAARVERWGAVPLMIVAMLAAARMLHQSIATAGMGVKFYIDAIPILCLAFVAWAATARRLKGGPRRAAMVVTIVLACGGWTLLRTEGVSAQGSDYEWRWSQSSEERLLARAEDQPTVLPTVGLAIATAAEWPGFRGPNRDGKIPGVRLETDWSAAPPIELWRRPIGPGWSSFAVHGDLVYTQEQRGEHEIVSCHDARTGAPVWRHRDATRFQESNGGAGPRATPTLDDGRVYTLGATGTLNALDATDGSVAWWRDVVSDHGVKVPYWGLSGSPLVTGGIVIVAASGRLAAYDAASGEPSWTGPAGGVTHSSPHRLTLDGVDQVVLMSSAGATSVAPADGKPIWEHSWPGFPVVQPALTAEGDLLISAGNTHGLRRLAIARGPAGWTVEERWTSKRLKPYFNDFVVHEGHAYGFDNSILACIDLEDGTRQWKGGRYGFGQLVLLPDQDMLLVVSEKGELALVEATPDGFTERARFAALDGKTWNHPVLVGDLLLVRNGEEMAAFQLALARG